MNEPNENKENDDKHGTTEKLSYVGCIALVITIIIFAGVLPKDTPLNAFNLSALMGKFGAIEGSTFMGKGGVGAKQGFLFALSLVPAVMLALGIVEVATHYGALKVAQRLLTPVLRPVLGLPGVTGLTLISSLQSTDAGAAMTRELYSANLITKHERLTAACFEFTAGAGIVNYLSSGMVIASFLNVSFIFPLLIILIFKVLGTNMMRFYIKTVLIKKEAKEEQTKGADNE